MPRSSATRLAVCTPYAGSPDFPRPATRGRARAAGRAGARPGGEGGVSAPPAGAPAAAGGGRPLHLAWRVIVVVVEANLPDGDDLGHPGERAELRVDVVVQRRRVV